MWSPYEHHKEPLLPHHQFILRMLLHIMVALSLLAVSLGIGILGYHFATGMSWLDALLNASMILGGMGPVDRIQEPLGKVFASFYALFSGMIFLVIAGVVIAPLAHRLLHRLHLDESPTE